MGCGRKRHVIGGEWGRKWIFKVLVIFFFFSPAMPCSMSDLNSLTRDWPTPPALKAWSLKHWTTRQISLLIVSFYFLCPLVGNTGVPFFLLNYKNRVYALFWIKFQSLKNVLRGHLLLSLLSCLLQSTSPFPRPPLLLCSELVLSTFAEMSGRSKWTHCSAHLDLFHPRDPGSLQVPS